MGPCYREPDLVGFTDRGSQTEAHRVRVREERERERSERERD